MAADGYLATDRRAFGDAADTYHRFRPGYDAAVYGLLRERCGLRPGIAGFEIGPGTGQATRVLLGMGVAPLVAIDPDERLAEHISRDADIDGDPAPSGSRSPTSRTPGCLTPPSTSASPRPRSTGSTMGRP